MMSDSRVAQLGTAYPSASSHRLSALCNWSRHRVCRACRRNQYHGRGAHRGQSARSCRVAPIYGTTEVTSPKTSVTSVMKRRTP